jgi:hypothetical protein
LNILSLLEVVVEVDHLVSVLLAVVEVQAVIVQM